MYLKFSIHNEQEETLWLTHETKSYCVCKDDDGYRIYYDRSKGLYEMVSNSSWLNCFVMNESGKTIDKIEANH